MALGDSPGDRVGDRDVGYDPAKSGLGRQGREGYAYEHGYEYGNCEGPGYKEHDV